MCIAMMWRSLSQKSRGCVMTAHSAWLALIDMQSAFGDPTSEWSAEGYAEIVPTVNNLVAEFGDRVVFTRFVRDPTEPGHWPACYDRWPSFQGQPGLPGVGP
jgi:nicotinamidase-related amidase